MFNPATKRIYCCIPGDQKASAGLVAGAVVGALIGAGLTVAGAVFYLKHTRRRLCWPSYGSNKRVASSSRRLIIGRVRVGVMSWEGTCFMSWEGTQWRRGLDDVQKSYTF